MTTKRGVNLGCGRIIMPREQPAHHYVLPGDLYTDTNIEWDNVDWQAGQGVDMVIDLFDYPWRQKFQHGVEVPIPDNTYDVALCTHLIEHIPHAVKRNGQVAEVHGGWFEWWNELGRVMKPGGVVYIITPYAFSRGGMMDPTHTRYILPSTFGYLTSSEDGDPFNKPLRYSWEAVYGPVVEYTELTDKHIVGADDTIEARKQASYEHLNMIKDLAIVLKVDKGE